MAAGGAHKKPEENEYHETETRTGTILRRRDIPARTTPLQRCRDEEFREHFTLVPGLNSFMAHTGGGV